MNTPKTTHTAPVARRQTIADGLHRTAQRLPAKTAIVCGSTRWSYAEFNALVSRLAAGLNPNPGVTKPRGQVLHSNKIKSTIPQWQDPCELETQGSGLEKPRGQVLHSNKIKSTIPQWQDPCELKYPVGCTMSQHAATGVKRSIFAMPTASAG